MILLQSREVNGMIKSRFVEDGQYRLNSSDFAVGTGRIYNKSSTLRLHKPKSYWIDQVGLKKGERYDLGVRHADHFEYLPKRRAIFTINTNSQGYKNFIIILTIPKAIIEHINQKTVEIIIRKPRSDSP